MVDFLIPKDIKAPISLLSSSIILFIVLKAIRNAIKIKNIGNTAAIESTLVALS